MLQKLLLPVGTLAALVIAYIVPQSGIYLKNLNLIAWLVVIIFWTYGYTHDITNIKFSRKTAIASVVIIINNLILSALIGSFFGWLLLPTLAAVGLLVITSMPPTLSSGIVITDNSDGNAVLALLFTIILNLVGIFLMPIMFKFTLAGFQNIDISSTLILLKLVKIILIPLVIGYFMKLIVPKYNHFNLYKLIPSICVILITFIGLSEAMSKIEEVNIGLLLLIIGASIIVHFILLAINWFIGSKIVRLEKYNNKAMIFVGSQKTLPIALFILFLILKDAALASVVCVLYYFLQILIDSAIAIKCKPEIKKSKA
ncbi:MAG TPA: bile acid:sodium symporter [Victivallales bacterium]|nr:bile acid:sodium symporter [Victivallales bacterium]